jgi:hypothetical protein
MHCPDQIDGNTYVELVAAVAILLSKQLSSLETFIFAEFLQSVGYQMVTIAAFKEVEEQKEAFRLAEEKRKKDAQKTNDEKK